MTKSNAEGEKLRDNMPDPDIDGPIARWQRKEELRKKRRALQYNLSEIERELESMEREDAPMYIFREGKMIKKGKK